MQQQVVRTRPPEGQHIDFVLPNILLSGFLFIGIGLVATGYHVTGLALAGWAALSILFVVFRSWAFDRHVWLSGNPVIVEQPEPETITQTQYAQQTKTPTGQVLTYSNISLPDSDWLKIAGLVIRNGSISRDDMIALDLIILPERVLKAKVNRTGMTGYENFITKATTAGWVKKEKGQTVLTDSGRAHFTSILYPPTPSDVSTGSPAHEATADGDGGEQ